MYLNLLTFTFLEIILISLRSKSTIIKFSARFLLSLASACARSWLMAASLLAGAVRPPSSSQSLGSSNSGFPPLRRIARPRSGHGPASPHRRRHRRDHRPQLLRRLDDPDRRFQTLGGIHQPARKDRRCAIPFGTRCFSQRLKPLGAKPLYGRINDRWPVRRRV